MRLTLPHPEIVVSLADAVGQSLWSCASLTARLDSPLLPLSLNSVRPIIRLRCSPPVLNAVSVGSISSLRGLRLSSRSADTDCFSALFCRLPLCVRLSNHVFFSSSTAALTPRRTAHSAMLPAKLLDVGRLPHFFNSLIFALTPPDPNGKLCADVSARCS